MILCENWQSREAPAASSLTASTTFQPALLCQTPSLDLPPDAASNHSRSTHARLFFFYPFCTPCDFKTTPLGRLVRHAKALSRPATPDPFYHPRPAHFTTAQNIPKLARLWHAGQSKAPRSLLLSGMTVVVRSTTSGGCIAPAGNVMTKHHQGRNTERFARDRWDTISPRRSFS